MQAEGDFYECPIHVAVRRRFTACVKLLLDFGADPNALTQFLESPLHVAAQEGSIPMAKMLLIAGCDHLLRTENGWTAFVAAQFAGHYGMHNYMRKVHDGRISVSRMQKAQVRLIFTTPSCLAGAGGWQAKPRGRQGDALLT